MCLNAEVLINTVQDPFPKDLLDYEELWSHLQQCPALQNKRFPERCNKDVWNAAMADCSRGYRAVVFTGTLSYTSPDSTASLLQFRLEPMRFDDSHRLGRRFGHDRFLELDFPHLSGKNVPGIVKKLGKQGQWLLVTWLVDGVHQAFGRTWKPFHLKPKERRNRKREGRDDEFDTGHRIHLFAVDGHGFESISNPLNSSSREKISIERLLDMIRPTDINKNEKFLKLFARTDLVVSKNTPTVTLLYSPDPERSQIRYQKDILYNGEVMTDGAGQLSFALAKTITTKMGLKYIPSGFQGRIGEAKGFWSVDYQDQSGKEWISCCESQRKWKRHEDETEDNHESHRTFEVLRFSAPLKAADLNLQFLPLLQDRAIRPKEMEIALKGLLEEGLERQLSELQTAMSDPQSLRQWLRGSAGGDRLKHGCVQYRAGLPVNIEERLNLFLDAGFDPRKLAYLKELARKAFKGKCDELRKRLNITVSKSTYAYMVPDFSEVLEPDEVYIDFSSFVDESTGFSNSNFLHSGMEMLVARSPAHYVSDIQKVKVVHKVELIGKKDVIVFSTKGNPSLAAKLSGGDYDGDIAWVCWEPAIVNNFQNAEIPKEPKLVAEGLIKKSSVTYQDLVKDQPDPTSTFLKESFKFNMQQNMLGFCTNFKERLCYTMDSVSSREAIYLSTLLSFLVDQAKQGYIFSEEDWEHFKNTAVNRKVIEPSYKTGQINPRSKHIIDRLMIAADTTINKLLTEFEKNTERAPAWDADLVKLYEWVKGSATTDIEWQPILENLDADIKDMKKAWARSMSSAQEQDGKEFLKKCDVTFDTFLQIRPRPESVLARALLPSCLPDEELSEWALIRASAFFASFAKRRAPPTYVWNIAGRQFARLKSIYGGGGFVHSVTPGMYAMLKPDAVLVKKWRAQRGAIAVTFDESSSVINADELEDFED